MSPFRPQMIIWRRGGGGESLRDVAHWGRVCPYLIHVPCKISHRPYLWAETQLLGGQRLIVLWETLWEPGSNTSPLCGSPRPERAILEEREHPPENQTTVLLFVEWRSWWNMAITGPLWGGVVKSSKLGDRWREAELVLSDLTHTFWGLYFLFQCCSECGSMWARLGGELGPCGQSDGSVF